LGESGQDLIEYALIAALVGLGCVVAMKSLTTSLNTVFNAIATSLNNSV
jgi:pilus assembly protein Flp/PilA